MIASQRCRVISDHDAVSRTSWHNWPFVRGIHQSQLWLVDSPHKGPTMQSFFFVIRLNKLLNEHLSCRWFETWCSCDITAMSSQNYVFFVLTGWVHLGSIVDILRLEQNGWRDADNIFNCIFLIKNYCILILISLKFVLKGPIDNKSPLSGSGNGLAPVYHQAITWLWIKIDQNIWCHQAPMS